MGTGHEVRRQPGRRKHAVFFLWAWFNSERPAGNRSWLLESRLLIVRVSYGLGDITVKGEGLSSVFISPIKSHTLTTTEVKTGRLLDLNAQLA